jgi:DNA invertase Pin-like site-specific DNA recombinase
VPCPGLRCSLGGLFYISGLRIGLACVSTRDQHPETQEDALGAAGGDPIFTDRVSGVLASRPGLEKALLKARAGDQLVVTRLDRWGRSLANLMGLSELLRQREIDLVVVEQGVDTSTAVGRMFFSILGSIAEFEHALLVERTSQGLAAARARGRVGGQKPKLTPRQARNAQGMYDELGEDGKRKYTVAEIATAYGVTRPTIYRHLMSLASVMEPPRCHEHGTTSKSGTFRSRWRQRQAGCGITATQRRTQQFRLHTPTRPTTSKPRRPTTHSCSLTGTCWRRCR